MRKYDEGLPGNASPSGVKIRMAPPSINYMAMAGDITKQMQAEEALRMANQRLMLHFSQTPMAVIEWDLKFRVVEWNPAAATIFGFSHEEAIGQHASFIVPERVRPDVSQVWQALLKRKGGERSSNENVGKDGGSIICEWYNTPLVDAHGEVVGVASLVMDITGSQHTQELLSWEKDALDLINGPMPLHDLLDALMCGLEKQAPGGLYSVLLLDDDGVHLRHGAAPNLPDAYNRAIDGIAIGPAVGSCGTAAYTNRQVIVSDIESDPLWTDYRETAREHGLRACWSTPICGRQGKTLGTFAVYYREPRRPFPLELDLIARATQITCIAIERKRADEALQESEVKFRCLFENAGDAIFLMQGELFVDCNVRTLEIFGCQSRGQIVGHPSYEFSPRLQPNGRDSREYAIEKITAAQDGQPQFFEWIHKKLDGTSFPAEVTLNTVTLGSQVMLQAIVRDISKRKRAEDQARQHREELAHVARVSAMGELTASLAHELNQPLAAILFNAQAALRSLKQDALDPDEIKEILDDIVKDDKRAGEIIHRVRSLMIKGEIEQEPLDLNDLISETIQLLNTDVVARRVSMTFKPDLTLPPILGNRIQVQQVLVNLVMNSCDAMQELGRDHRQIVVRTAKQDESNVEVSVRDSGIGFDDEVIDRIFEPFYSTKPSGMGMGLAINRSIIEAHGGSLQGNNNGDQGATFLFTLPIMIEEPQ